ncbi:uncharacterized protein LOC107496341 isoform X2 [Arachis duranensis]|uniref:Uncharacterized protein LOC107496341 isoform X2 n=1 Tax=Arachis duranensis TaxID=130453 RepID=A0A6P4DS07_ARADU|nr:uncharacterized protein LOC107496341 isoform X2 [Arachis duranensis]XP_020982761.1 uncharacterized protein LOC107496341 isoform X2 [Arachis duranensis]
MECYLLRFLCPNTNADLEAGNSAGFHAVAFSYENPNESAVIKDDDTETGFHPQFPVPENLLNNLPPNEKVHQIISRTAMFVSKHGSQSEIVLRVKQGDNPTFGFLMPDHRLHSYFRYLVDHQELLTIDNNGNSSMDKNRSQGLDQTGGALSLLGSVYGSGEDEEGTNENTQEVERKVCEDSVGAANNASMETEQAESSSDAAKKDGSISKNPVSSLKEKVPVIKRNHSISNVKAVAASKEKTSDASDSVTNAADKSHTPVPNTTKISLPIVEPPSDLKRAIEKIAEFIVNNGKQFEAVLAEQDRAHGRFPFLVPSNRYHTYYLKVLQTTEESKLSGKVSQKQNSAGRAGERNTVREESDKHSCGSLGSDLPCDKDRKEKFKMIVGSKSKKDDQDQIPQDNQSQNVVSVNATAAAAILQAATRGIKKPNLELFSKTSSGNGQGLGSDGGHLSSTGSLYSSQLQRLVESSNLKVDISGSARAIAETVAIAAAREADSSEAHMTKEEKLKADRLKRAKMFAAMLKNGVAPVKSETTRGLSVDPPGSGLSGSDAEAGSLVGKEREGSSVPFDVDNSDRSQKSEEKHSVDNSDTSHKSKEKLAVDNNEQQKSKRKYRSRSGKQEVEEEEEEEEEENTEDKRDHKQSRKKHRSHRSSHSSHDRHKHKHKRKHSSSKDRYSHKRHKDDSSSDEEDHHSRHHHKKDSSDDDKYRSSRQRHKENNTSDNEHRRSRHRNKHYSSSDDDEQRHRSRNVKHRSRYHAEKERDLEEGEIVAKSDKSKAKEVGSDSREASVARVPSQSPETTEVSDELRAKIRAMLMANL